VEFSAGGSSGWSAGLLITRDSPKKSPEDGRERVVESHARCRSAMRPEGVQWFSRRPAPRCADWPMRGRAGGSSREASPLPRGALASRGRARIGLPASRLRYSLIRISRSSVGCAVSWSCDAALTLRVGDCSTADEQSGIIFYAAPCSRTNTPALRAATRFAGQPASRLFDCRLEL